MLPRATATLARSALAARASAARCAASTTMSGGTTTSGKSSPLLSAAAAARALSTIGGRRKATAAAHLLSAHPHPRALASSGVATKSGVGGEGLTTVTPERRLSAIARMWARTRDMPELGVMYAGVLTGLTLLVYTFSELVFATKRGEHVGILLNPDVRGDFDRQLASADASAHEAARRRGGAPAASSGPAGGRASLWYWLGHLMIDDRGANVSIPPFDNRKVRGPFPYNKPGEAGLGAGGDAYGSPPADVKAAATSAAR